MRQSGSTCRVRGWPGAGSVVEPPRMRGRSWPPHLRGERMARKIVHSDDAPKAIGPYSQAVQVDAGKMTFLSGQIPLDPKKMTMIQGDVVDQAEQVMKNLGAGLQADRKSTRLNSSHAK